MECMQAISGCTGNKDLEPFLPVVIEAASSIQNTHKCVEKLAGCVFVQNVETKALAVMLPVLQRGLTDKAEEVKRTCCQIVDNMCKVVEDPASLIPVMPILEPLAGGRRSSSTRRQRQTTRRPKRSSGRPRTRSPSSTRTISWPCCRGTLSGSRR